MDMYNSVITLLTITESINAVGDRVETVVRNDVFADARSIGMREKYEALGVGLKPELLFVLADYLDYDEQQFIEYNSRRYSVLRTYQGRNSNELEIVVTR